MSNIKQINESRLLVNTPEGEFLIQAYCVADEGALTAYKVLQAKVIKENDHPQPTKKGSIIKVFRYEGRGYGSVDNSEDFNEDQLEIIE